LNSKGFAFTLDALFAIGLILSAGTFLVLGTVEETPSYQFDSLRMGQNDLAIVSHYMHIPKATSLPDTAKQGYCYTVYSYYVSFDHAALEKESSINQRAFCGDYS